MKSMAGFSVSESVRDRGLESRTGWEPRAMQCEERAKAEQGQQQDDKLTRYKMNARLN